MRLEDIRTILTRPWAALVLVAMLARALVPAGYMPAVNATSGQIEIVMCSPGAEHQTVTFKLPVKAPSSPSPDMACPCALNAPAGLPEPEHLTTSLAAYTFEYATRARPAAVLRLAWSPHAPPTGPPALSA
jgi:hypothetical protein